MMCFILGVTCHWLSLFVHKINGKIEAYVLDSRNFDYLALKENQIQQGVKDWHSTLLIRGRKPWKPYMF